MISAKFFILCLSLISCAKPEVTTVANEPKPPAALQRAVMLKDGEGAVGWAAPIGMNRLLTVKHLADTGDSTWRTKDGEMGTARTIWQSEDRDIAILHADDEERHLMPFMQFANREPEPQEQVWLRYYLVPGGEPVIGRAYAIGKDSDGDWHLDGAAYPGASGSPVVDRDGRVLLIVSRGFNQSALFIEGQSLMEKLFTLAKKSSFRAAIIAERVNSETGK